MNETINDELVIAQADFIHTVITIADTYGIDRDELLQGAVNSVRDAVTMATFRNYQLVGQTTADKHWSECRQIALYDDQVKKLQDQVDRLKGIIDGMCGYMSDTEETAKLRQLLTAAVSDIRGCDKCVHGKQVDKLHRVYTCQCKEFGGKGGYIGSECDSFRWVRADEAEQYLSHHPD